MSKQYMSLKELSEHFSIPTSTLYRWVNERKLPYYKVGKMLRFDVWEMTQWISAFKVAPFELDANLKV